LKEFRSQKISRGRKASIVLLREKQNFGRTPKKKGARGGAVRGYYRTFFTGSVVGFGGGRRRVET